jgi:hypothetical protein
MKSDGGPAAAHPLFHSRDFSFIFGLIHPKPYDNGNNSIGISGCLQHLLKRVITIDD